MQEATSRTTISVEKLSSVVGVEDCQDIDSKTNFMLNWCQGIEKDSNRQI